MRCARHHLAWLRLFPGPDTNLLHPVHLRTPPVRPMLENCPDTTTSRSERRNGSLLPPHRVRSTVMIHPGPLALRAKPIKLLFLDAGGAVGGGHAGAGTRGEHLDQSQRHLRGCLRSVLAPSSERPGLDVAKADTPGHPFG